MPVSLKNKLLQFEAVPPADMWGKIAIQLDDEFVASDAPMALKLENAEVAPPPAFWENIETALDKTNISRTAKVVPVYGRMAFAAAMIGVIVLAAVYFLSDNVEAGKKEVVSNTAIVPGVNENIAENDPPSPAIQPERTAGSSVESTQTGPSLQRKELTVSRNSYRQSQAALAGFDDMDIDDPKPVRMISAMEPVQVDAPPIRDARGNVIMDLSVISHPNEPYITVTSPNGSQTKISKKFLSCLSYLNGNYAASEINYEGQQWKSRFAEWRNKISEAGFVPGANNFFDIFELQELIRD